MNARAHAVRRNTRINTNIPARQRLSVCVRVRVALCVCARVLVCALVEWF